VRSAINTPFADGMTLGDALRLAGGLLPNADYSRVEVSRLNAFSEFQKGSNREVRTTALLTEVPRELSRDLTADSDALKFALQPLQITDLDGFLALRESAPCPALQALADGAVTALDAHRAPATEAEIARRKPEKLSPRQRDYLAAWGYPYVFAEWRFHMTLTRRLTPVEKATILPAVTEALGDAPAIARTVTDICIFAQAAPGAPFTILERLKLRG
jgi:hypothetical protein